jgi:hypothetical protein
MARARPTPRAGRDLCRRAIGNPPARRNPGSFDWVDALEAALRYCLGLPPVS